MKSLSFTQLYTEDVIIVAAPDHPLAGATGLDQLLGYPILYPPRGSAIRPLVARQMIARGLPLFSNRIECASADFGRAYLAGPERALWFISQGVVAADLAAGRMVQLPIELPVTNGPIGILARSEEVPSPAAHLFRQALIAVS
jgi:LysR family pca operon transcriptional activator